VLWEEGHVKQNSKIVFHSKSGPLTAERSQVGRQDLIELDFHARPNRAYEGDTKALGKALKASPQYVGAYADDDVIAVFDAEQKVRDLAPDLRLLKALNVRGVAVTGPPSRATMAEGYDFVSRFFAPGVGINEDPVTGSAHTCLGPYWSKRLGKKMVVRYQASARGGTVRVWVEGDRVKLGGQAVTVVRGELML
jgi:PhzF family phenazine biosynthesis protein